MHTFMRAGSALIGILGLALAQAAHAVDSDGDGIQDNLDNCTLDANANQRDTDGDGYGNVCDADLTGDLVINFGDLGVLKGVFFTNDADADFNGDGSVNFGDLGTMKSDFFGAPGPSGVAGAPTYTDDVQPIFFAKCDPCHTGLGFGGHDIGVDYNDAFLPANDYNECQDPGLNVGECTIVLIRSGEMPLGAGCSGNPAQDAGNPDCLTQAEQDAVQGWIDAGLRQ